MTDMTDMTDNGTTRHAGRFEMLPGERTVLVSPKHWRNYMAPVLGMLLCLAGTALRLAHPDVCLTNMATGTGFVPGWAVRPLSYAEAIALTACTAVLAASLVTLAHTRYYVTTRRVVSVSGWIRVAVGDMMLDRCETVLLTQRLPERIFGSGDILCVGAGSTLLLDDVLEARRFKQEILTLITEMDTYGAR